MQHAAVVCLENSRRERKAGRRGKRGTSSPHAEVQPLYKRARSVAQVWLELGHVLVQDVPELLQRGAVQVALVAVQLEHVHMSVYVQWKVLTTRERKLSK